MRKVWDIDVDGRRRRIDVDWDTTMSGAGVVRVDDVVRESWGWGVKWTGVSHDFVIDSAPARVTQSWFGFDLAVNGREVEGATRVRGISPVTAKALPVAIAIVAVVVATMLVVAAIFAAS